MSPDVIRINISIPHDAFTSTVFPISLIATAQAGELTLEEKPFSVSHEFPATIVPSESVPIRLDPDIWTEFEIESIADHGAEVAKGQTLLKFEQDDIEEKIEASTPGC